MRYLKILLAKWGWWQRQKKIHAIRRRNRRLKAAIKEANALTNWDRKTRYVFERGDQFDVMSTSDINVGRRMGKFARHVKITDIYEKACYTATFNPTVKENWERARNMEKERIEKRHKK